MGLDLADGEQRPHAREEVVGVMEGMDADEREEALVDAVVALAERVERLETSLHAVRGALGHLSST